MGTCKSEVCGYDLQASGAAKLKGANGSSSSQNSSGFLVQQPSSKLWMEAVPMRCQALCSHPCVHLKLTGARPNALEKTCSRLSAESRTCPGLHR